VVTQLRRKTSIVSEARNCRGISSEQAVDEAIARIKQILSE
jgi:hypothetical protein